MSKSPPHVLFVFCTTELHQMMATVRDRCQRIAMRSPGPDTLVQVLEKVSPCKIKARKGDVVQVSASRVPSRQPSQYNQMLERSGFSSAA